MREREEERVRMAPNMGAGGSHPQATSDPGEGEMAEEKETRGMRWADCENDDGEKNKEEQEKEEAESKKEQEEAERKQEQEQEQEGDRKKEAEEKKEQEEGARQREMTDERPPGLEEVESKSKTQGEEQNQMESEQEAQEEESGRAREQKRAQEAREDEESRAQEAREEEWRAQEAREEERRAQEAREKETRAQEEQEEERKVEAQEGHDGEEEMTTQENCVEAKKETNSMHEEGHVSNRHMIWWQNAWWVRVNSGPFLRTARDRRKVWRAATRAAQEVRETGKVAGREREEWEKRETERRESWTLSSGTSGSRCISRSLPRRRIRRRIRLCQFCTLIDIVAETGIVSSRTLPVGLPLPTISESPLCTLFCPLILDHGVCLIISIAGFRILNS